MRTPFLFTSILALALAFSFSFSCAELPTIPGGVCGNGIIEEGEFCDSGGAGLFPKTACGQPSDGARACKLTCHDEDTTDKLKPECPGGWQCGYDEICRKESGSFERSGPIAADIRQLAVADFDLDRRGDVVTLGSSEVAVHYFEGSQVAQVNRIAMSGQTPAIGQLTDDGRADLVFAVGPGIGALLGQEDRTLRPVFYTSEQLLVSSGRPVAGDFEDPLSKTDSILYVVNDRVYRGLTALPMLTLDEKKERYFTDEPIPTAELLDLDPMDSSDDCEEMVLSVISKEPGVHDRLLVVSPCPESFTTKSFDVGGKIAGPVRIADVNGDGQLDLALARAAESPTDEFAEYYHLITIDGPLDPATDPDPGPCVHANFGHRPEDPFCSDELVPLAVGDFNGDRTLDVVEPCAIRLSPTPAAGCGGHGVRLDQVMSNAAAPWMTARVGDINRDGRDDVVAASALSAGLAMFRSVGETGLAPVVLPTLLSVEEIALGDFDGDDFDDVALRQRLDLVSSSLSVVFGQADGVPDPPVEIGRSENIEQMVVASSLSSDLSAYGIDDLAVVLRPPHTWNARVSVFMGSSSRLLQSTFGFVEESSNANESRVPRRVTLGRFHPGNEDSTVEVGALVRVQDSSGSATSREIWSARIDRTRGSLSAGPDNPVRMASSLDYEDLLPQSLSYSAHVGAINMADGVDRMVIAGPSPAGQPMLLLVTPCSDATCSVAKVEDILQDAGSSMEASLFRIEHLGIADINNDERRDVTLLLRTQVNGAPDTSSSDIQSRVLVFSNTGSGLEAKAEVELPSGDDRESGNTVGDALDKDITAFAWLNVDADPDLELLLLTPRGLHCADALDPPLEEPSEICEKYTGQRSEMGDDDAPETWFGGRALAVGDVNGDGLQDVVVGTEGQFELLLAIPEKP